MSGSSDPNLSVGSPGLLPANVNLLQPASGFYRMYDVLRALDQSSQTTTLANQIGSIEASITALQEQMATLQGQVTTLQGQVSTLQSQMQTLILFMNSFNWVQAEVSTGLIFLDSRTLYTRSFVISGALNTALNLFTFAHGVANINYIAQGIGVAGINSGQGLPLTFTNATTAPNMSDAVSFFADTTNIYVTNGGVIRTNYLVLVKLYYTCTDR